MNILIATGLYSPETGGPATYAAMIAHVLPTYGYSVTVMPFSQVRHFPKIVRHLVYGWRIFCATKHVDIVYALDPVSVGLPAMIVARLRRKIFLVRLGGDYAWEQGRQRFGLKMLLDEYVKSPRQASWSVRMLAWIQTRVTKQAARVVAPSAYLKGVIVSWGVCPERVQVIYSAFSAVSPAQSKAATKQEYVMGSPALTTAARLVPWKGVSELVTVARELRNIFPNLTLTIIGEGPQALELKSQIKRLGAESYITMVGKLPRADVGSVVSASDVFVLNTGYEGLSHQLLEAMSWRTPIVTTEIGGNQELFKNNQGALLVPYQDTHALQKAILQVLQNHDLAATLIDQAAERVSVFTDVDAVASLVELLESVYEK